MELNKDGWCSACDTHTATVGIDAQGAWVDLCAHCLVKALALFPTEDIMRIIIAQQCADRPNCEIGEK